MDVIIGAVLGIVAGLTPGIHSNTFAALLAAFYASEGSKAAIAAAAIAYTIADIVPTTFLGVPDEETAVSVLPAHRLVLEGKGFECISISAISSTAAVLLSFTLYFTVAALARNYRLLKSATLYVLLFFSALLVLSERGEMFGGSLSAWRKRFSALLVFLLSGCLGYFALSNSELARVNPAGSVLLPLLTGLFAAPVLLHSSSSTPPKQRITFELPEYDAVLKGTLAGFLVSLFPGISSGVATLIASYGEGDAKRYVSTVSAANSANAVLCLLLLHAAGVARSGAAKAIGSISLWELLLSCSIAALIALPATLLAAVLFARGLNFKFLSPIVLVFLIAVVLLLTGLFGLLIFALAAVIGTLAVKLGVKRVNCMGCLMLPVMIRYATRI